MSDNISRQAAMAYPLSWEHYDMEHGDRKFICGVESYREYIEHLPSTDRNGHWTLTPMLPENHRYECSNCKRHHRERYDFCPSCGTDMRGGSMRMIRDLTEMNKLEDYLKANGFEYQREDEDAEPMDKHQIIVFDDGVRSWDVICHYGSYGCDEGLLEGMGDLFGPDVDGYLTAEDVIKKIEEVRS